MLFLSSSPLAIARATAACLLTSALLFSGCNRGTSTANSPAAPAAASSTAAATPSQGKSAPSAQSPGSVRRAAESERDRSRQSAGEMVPVETALVTRGPISAFLSFNSTVETEAMVDIYPQTTGQVEMLLVEEGQIVKAGDPLLQIEDRELRLEVEESTANFTHLERNFGRSEDLFTRNLINKQDYENQKYQVEQARLRLERAKIRLSYATVRAPFAGVLSTREVQVGARVANGTKLFSLVKLDELVARVFVPGRYLPAVAADQPAIITSEFLPNRTFEGFVKRISPVIDPKSGTFKVTVGVRGETPGELPPGLFVGVRVITDTRKDAILIPKRAVVYEGGERHVYLVVDNRAVKKKLTVGYEDPNYVESLGGFEVGAAVIVLGQGGLKDGALVRAVNTTGPIVLPDATTTPASASPERPAQATTAPREAAKPGV